MKTFKELNERVVTWESDKGILEKATPLTQHSKPQEEVNELYEALFAQQNDLIYFTNSKGSCKNTQEEIKDAIGDTLVTLLIQCRLQNLNPLDCLESALNVIEKRKGKMVGGVFLKDN
jgi:NTP pyrophosphatase (non-canonical NTP hydrolase)